MKQLTIILSITFIFSLNLSSQDLHFSNYEYSPLYLSPAKTGHFGGTFRVGANIREQFDSFIEKPYQTVMAYIDSPIAFGFSKKHWVGIGMNIYADRSGDLSFSNSGVLASVGYHIGLDDKFQNVLTFGIQYGATQRRINSEEARWVGQSENELLDQFNPSISDLNFGVTFKKATSKTSHFEVGAAMYHLLQPTFEFNGSNVDNPVKRRLNLYGEYHIQSTDQLLIKPVVVYSRMYNFQNLYGQFNLEYQVNKKKSTIIKGGLGYRSGDAVQLLAGVIYKGWNVGLAYDLTVSSASAYNNSFGGIELGVYRIFTINKKPKLNPKELCPRL